MKTITKTYNVYTFDELSDEAKEKAHSDYIQNGDCWHWGGEARDTIEAVENLLHITLKNWSIGSYRPEYPNVEFDDWWYNSFGDPKYELSGNRARSFLWNNFGHVILSPRTHYYYKDASGKFRNGISANSVKRTSKVFFDRIYDGTCPMTGVCFDCDALDPMAYFCFGVRWSESEKRRVPTRRDKYRGSLVTVEEVIRYCVRSMFDSFCKDVEYSESMECFSVTCDVNGWEFLEDGTMC